MTDDDGQLPGQGPTKDYCEGNQEKCGVDGCPKFGALGRPSRDGQRRVKGCGDPVARGKRNKRKGSRAQSKALTAIGVPRSTMHPGHEEHIGGTVRVEVKAGAQVGPVWTRFVAAETQSEGARPFGDHRPFLFLCEPAGTSDGLVVFRRSQLTEVVAALAEQLFAGEDEEG